MRRPLPPLNALRAFEAAARHLSFTGAAAELHVTQGAVSRQVQSLERHLGRKLFRRLTRSIQLTDEGRAYCTALQDAFTRIERATKKLSGSGDSGVLTISALLTFSMKWLVPRLPTFTRSYPKIEVHIVTSMAPVDFAREDIDLAIRVGWIGERKSIEPRPRLDFIVTESWSGLAHQKLVPDLQVPVCSPALVTPDRPLRHPEDLRNFSLLHTATRAHAWGDWCASVGLEDLDPGQSHSFGHFFMTIQAAVEGRGIALVPRVLIEREVGTGSLIIPFEAGAKGDLPHYHLLGLRQNWEEPKIKRFREWIRVQARQYTLS